MEVPPPPRSKFKDLAERIPIGAHKRIDRKDLFSLAAALNKVGKGLQSADIEGDKEHVDIWVREKKKAKAPRKPRAKKTDTATTAAA